MSITKVILACCLVAAITSQMVPKDVQSPFTWQENPVNGPLPANWHWGNVNGTNYLCTTKNQHIPQYCGSCWAQAATASISDRIAIMRGGKFPEIDISPQVLLNCDMMDNGCHGGEPLNAFKWMHDNIITDSSCAPYRALSHFEGLKCDAMAICKDCDPNAGCAVPQTYNKYQVGEYGRVPSKNPEALQNEIYARGPVVCGVDAAPIVGYTGGVFASSQFSELNHAISVVGWGVTKDGNTPYWVVRNSWGEYWGELGYIRIYRGNNTVGIETDCTYGVPVNTWKDQKYPNMPAATIKSKGFSLINTAKQVYTKFFAPRRQTKHRGCLKDAPHTEFITGPQPKDMPTALPENHWWGDIDGTNYLSWVVNQHIPQYCGSCWAQSASSAMADRINIMNGNGFPRTALAVQVLINCNAGGSCEGGSMGGPYAFAKKHGIPDMGCQVYEAADPKKQECSAMQVCKNCHWGANFTQICEPVTNYPKWYAIQYGAVTGADDMKKELLSRGPISCQMMVTDKFEKYTGGIYSERSLFVAPNHAISVTGWGKDQKTGTEYWIVRNSWGSHFGEGGFFRLQMHTQNLGIDSHQCFWAVPSATPAVSSEVKLTSE